MGDRPSLDGRDGLQRGESLGLQVCGTWLHGRAEYSRGSEKPYVGWYFCGNDRGWCPLVAAMWAREAEERADGRCAW